jgi:hypothetical protein
MKLKKMSELQEGDIIAGSNNEPVRVVSAYPVHIPERMYSIELENGKTIKASGNHLWYVETELDKELYSDRLRRAKKVFKKLDERTLAQLEAIARSEKEIETSIIDMLSLLGLEDNKEGKKVIIRIAESIGHIAEDSVTYEDLMTGEKIAKRSNIRTYNAKLMAQQILRLTQRKRYKKEWPIILGKVLTTEDLTLLQSFQIDIPTLESRSI